MALAAFIADDWIGAAAVLALWLCIKLVATGDRLFVLPLALTFQWTQTALGVFYKGFTGREVQAHYASDYRPMVLIGLGCCLALARRHQARVDAAQIAAAPGTQPRFAFGFGPLAMVVRRQHFPRKLAARARAGLSRRSVRSSRPWIRRGSASCS